MLRLKQKNMLINPAHIAGVSIFEKSVNIYMSDESSLHCVSLETEEQAIYFAEYVRLLVDITNRMETPHIGRDIGFFELYFQWKGVLTPEDRPAIVTKIRKQMDKIK